MPNAPNNPQGVRKAQMTNITAGYDVPKPPTWLTGIGAKMMMGVLIVICLTVVAFLISWWSTQPTLEHAKQLATAVQSNDPAKAVGAKDLADLLAQLQREHTNAYRDFFQLLVLSGLVPLFTLLAGYVFGKQAGRADDASGGE